MATCTNCVLFLTQAEEPQKSPIRRSRTWLSGVLFEVNEQIHQPASSNGEQAQSHELNLALSKDEVAAVEGWRTANDIPTTAEAVRELVRLGLLSEISKVYGVVSAVRKTISP